jgi:hypothetical protein
MKKYCTYDYYVAMCDIDLAREKARYSAKYAPLITVAEAALEELKTMETLLKEKAVRAARKADIVKMQKEAAAAELGTLKSKLRRTQDLVSANGRAYKRRNKSGEEFSAVPHPHYCKSNVPRENEAFKECQLSGCPRT